MSNEEKLFYSIGEVAEIVQVKPYVLRYWETEFKKLNPQKSFTGQRTYKVKDIQVALTIKKLLYDDKYTIAGAVQRLVEMETQGQLVPFGTATALAPEATPMVDAKPVVETPIVAEVAPVTEPSRVEAVPVAETTAVEAHPKEEASVETPVTAQSLETIPEKPKLDEKKIKDLKGLVEATKRVLKKYNLS